MLLTFIFVAPALPLHLDMEKLKTGAVWLDEAGFLRISFDIPEGHVFGMEDAKKQVEACLDLLDNVRRPVIVDLRNIGQVVTYDITHFLANEPRLSRLKIAQAFISQSLSGWLVANYHLKYSGAGYPSREFFAEADAVAWLKEICICKRKDMDS